MLLAAQIRPLGQMYVKIWPANGIPTSDFESAERYYDYYNNGLKRNKYTILSMKKNCFLVFFFTRRTMENKCAQTTFNGKR